MSRTISKFDRQLRSFVADENDTIHVCAWCFPLDSIFERFPHLRGRVAISHGICPEHNRRMAAEIAAVKI